MSTEIFYFSGTGNSMHIARELHRRLPDSKLLPIVRLLNKEMIVAAGETVGFVLPQYFTTVPAPVRQFVKKLDMSSAKYTFSGSYGITMQ